MDYETLEAMQRRHPAWRLLLADSAPLVASFLHRVFVAPNVRVISQADLIEALEDTLFALREQLGAEVFPKRAQDYLNDWAANERSWLRKFYPNDSDEPHFDLMPATEKAIGWLTSLTERSFVGTESRLLTLFDLLKQMSQGSETDPQVRLLELQKQRAEIDLEIALVSQGQLSLLDDTAIRDRFQQFMGLARELLGDFREVEQNFRGLDRHVRERIALWEGSKGELLQQIIGERDLIVDSDQGRSFRAFWDFLMSHDRQEELTQLLDKVLQLPPIVQLKPDVRTRRVHYDWLEAGEHTQRTVALLSQQLRRFLDDQAYLENRRIMDLLRGIESQAMAVRDMAPSGSFMQIDDTAADIELPMERPLHTLPIKPLISSSKLDVGDADIDATALFSQFTVDSAELSQRVRRALQGRSQITLADLLAEYPLQQGLAELIAYLQLASERGDGKVLLDDDANDSIAWQAIDGNWKRAVMPRVVFIK
ncbi:hypothetical protein CR155_06515 [Pollutimonas nitritireducens]|uniref:DUF3375 domain-containing protein n=1 Tax=Pollutimonas nitritireducens TaxID=2045209 RepID=A0A2N4UHE8_9BURK|nr:DUF3375 domain-containing protein [Pollutimonas nitritireducens]PLC54430.1 hypothetical protein CR155_06515 [Pollutimonas nitritireducens]